MEKCAVTGPTQALQVPVTPDGLHFCELTVHFHALIPVHWGIPVHPPSSSLPGTFACHLRQTSIVTVFVNFPQFELSAHLCPHRAPYECSNIPLIGLCSSL